ncbi:MAG: hypothetical protein J6M18_05460 [Actinomycetaceae bacterium]|nr:hypothetical protein [Actinomycetaceae bacterium]
MTEKKIARLVMGEVTDMDRVKNGCENFDVYSLPSIDLSKYVGLIISMGCDQRFLLKHQEKIASWVENGGRVLVNGQPVLPFLPKMPVWRKLMFHGVDDIWLTRVNEHPIWEGIEMKDLLLRTGVPGEHTFEELLDIGVGGFYARAYMVGLSDDAVVVNGIGSGQLPVDVVYPLGRGEVIMHSGNDLEGFDTTCGEKKYLRPRVLAYLSGDEHA